jgi:hypothetical protein
VHLKHNRLAAARRQRRRLWQPSVDQAGFQPLGVFLGLPDEVEAAQRPDRGPPAHLKPVLQTVMAGKLLPGCRRRLPRCNENDFMVEPGQRIADLHGLDGVRGKRGNAGIGDGDDLHAACSRCRSSRMPRHTINPTDST